LVPSWAADLADTRQVPENERLHLSLLHAACVSEQDAVIPWRHGAPGINQVELMRSHRHDRSANESSRVEDAELQAELIRQDDPNLLEKLRACPDVDVFLPSGLRGNGYCEDAVAYAKCASTLLSHAMAAMLGTDIVAAHCRSELSAVAHVGLRGQAARPSAGQGGGLL
jgi:hypothetical protein